MSGSSIPPPFSRRDFLFRGVTRAIESAAGALGEVVAPVSYIRAPGALPEAAFIAACTRCGACRDACPVGAVRVLGPETGLAAGTPVLAPDTIACAMCPDMPCAAACPTDALQLPMDGWRGVRFGTLVVDRTRCIAHRDVSCGVCARVCPVGPDALALDRLGRPQIGDACTGCGTCVSACVTDPSSLSIFTVRSTE